MSLRRMEEDLDDRFLQVLEQIVEVLKVLPEQIASQLKGLGVEERISERSGVQTVDLPVPQVMESVEMQLDCVVEQIVADPVPQIMSDAMHAPRARAEFRRGADRRCACASDQGSAARAGARAKSYSGADCGCAAPDQRGRFAARAQSACNRLWTCQCPDSWLPVCSTCQSACMAVPVEVTPYPVPQFKEEILEVLPRPVPQVMEEIAEVPAGAGVKSRPGAQSQELGVGVVNERVSAGHVEQAVSWFDRKVWTEEPLYCKTELGSQQPLQAQDAAFVYLAPESQQARLDSRSEI